MRSAIFHEGPLFRAETNPLYGSIFIVHKPSGRSVYLRGNLAWKFQDALCEAWNRFGFETDGDTVHGWLWTNAGFHRFA